MLIVLYFIGLIIYHPESVLLVSSPYPLPGEYGAMFDSLLWVIFGMLLFDLYMKYKKYNSWKVFLKKHWIDIFLFALIPVLSAFKIAKLAVKLVKFLKAIKTGYKAADKTKKISENLNNREKTSNSRKS